MKIVFAGTPEFSLPVLEVLLHSRHPVSSVYTQPDRPAGRGRRTRISPVKQLARQHDIPVCQPVSLRGDAAREELAAWQADLMVVVAYGLILPPAVLALPRLGCVNVHASLLPRWRGAAPIQRALLAGDSETGVTLMQMEAGLDTGPILASARCPIPADMTGGQLHDRLAEMGAQLLGDNLEGIARGELEPHPQDDRLASYANKVDKQEALIDWSLPAGEIDRKVRAFNPWPVAETRYAGRQLRIWEARPLAAHGETPPGRVLAAGKSGIDVACGEGVLRVLRVQLPGARALAAADFVNAHALEGVSLGG